MGVFSNVKKLSTCFDEMVHVTHPGALFSHRSNWCAEDYRACRTAANQLATESKWKLVDGEQSGAVLILSNKPKLMEAHISDIDCPEDCDPDNLDRAVMIAGYGSEHSVNYWPIRISWRCDWGEEGYKRLCAGQDECGVARDVVMAINIEM